MTISNETIRRVKRTIGQAVVAIVGTNVIQTMLSEDWNWKRFWTTVLVGSLTPVVSFFQNWAEDNIESVRDRR